MLYLVTQNINTDTRRFRKAFSLAADTPQEAVIQAIIQAIAGTRDLTKLAGRWQVDSEEEFWLFDVRIWLESAAAGFTRLTVEVHEVKELPCSAKAYSGQDMIGD